jgi:hypothetical protein
VKPVETAVARQWLSSDHMVTPIDTIATVEYLWEAVFSTQSVPRCYRQDQLADVVSLRMLGFRCGELLLLEAGS